MTTHDNEPLTRLDETLDVLSVALARTADLDGLVASLRLSDLAIRSVITVDHPFTADALAVADVWRAFADVAEEVLTLRNMKENG